MCVPLFLWIHANKGWQVPQVRVKRNGGHVHRGAEVVCEPADGQPGEHARVQGRRVQAAEAQAGTQHLHHRHGAGGREPALQVRCGALLHLRGTVIHM